MNADLKISIIIPVFNGEKNISHTVETVLRSSYRNLEILLVDDGSTDHSPALCDALAKSDPRIRVYHKANGGIADARNYGLEHATGNFIAFCDQDDEISIEMYHKMMGRIASDHSQAAICGCCRQKKNGGKVIFEQYTDDILESQQIKEKLLLPMLFKGFAVNENQEISIYPSIWKCLISRQFIDQHKMRFRIFVNYEDDLIMLLQLFLYADRVSTLSDILYYWNTNLYSETHRSAVRYLNNLEARQKSFLDYVTNLLSESGIALEIIKQYTYVQQCRNALLQLDNLSAMNSRKTLQHIKGLRTNSSISYICSARDIVPPAKGFIRNTVLIPLLRRKHVITAYFMNQLINSIRFFVEKYRITEQLERWLKRSA